MRDYVLALFKPAAGLWRTSRAAAPPCGGTDELHHLSYPPVLLFFKSLLL